MASLKLRELSSSSLKGKVFVLTGGSNGIGEATVRLIHGAGGSVVVGDKDPRGEALAKELSPSVSFQQTDVTDYDSVVSLFEYAFKKHGRVDCAIANAGVIETGQFISPSLTRETVRQHPNMLSLDVNLTGALYFSRVATVYLREGAIPNDDKSLILLSSVAGFKESPGLTVYQTAKHGVIGLMRSLRLYSPQNLGVRVNCICPWATETGMTAAFTKLWVEAKLPMNSPKDVGMVIVTTAMEKDLNGESIYVEGGRGWKFEANIDKLEPQWLGEAASARLNEGQKFLAEGSKWGVK